jgi:hypothetical protein
MWVTGASPCAEAFIPWYLGMTESPAGFQRFDTAEEALEKHFSDSKQMKENYPDGIAWKFVERWHWILEDYYGRSGEIQQANKKFQKKLFSGQHKFEESVKNMNGEALQNALNTTQRIFTKNIFQATSKKNNHQNELLFQSLF